MTARKSGALAHLTHLYDDSDAESDSDESPINENKNTDSKNFNDTPESMDHQQIIGTDEDDQESQELDKSKEIPIFTPVSPETFHRKLQDVKLSDEIRIPPPPPGQPPLELTQKINHLHSKMKQGIDMKASIEKRKDFRNPSIYEKLIAFCEIDELGTNFPKDIYDPHQWGPEAYYDELANRQKEEMDRKEKEKKEKTKVEFVSGTAKKNQGENETRKKSKWDVSSSSSSSIPLSSSSLSSSILPTAAATTTTTTTTLSTNITTVVSTASTTKTTVTSKVGALIPGLNIKSSLVGGNSNTSVLSSTVGTVKPPVFTIKGTK